jgi:hypothetical protein
MRAGALILFIASLLIFVIGFSTYFFVTGNALAQGLAGPSLLQSKFVLICISIAEGLRNAVWSFFGACLLYRLDAHWGDTGKSRS